jgi:hypothetical protein
MNIIKIVIGRGYAHGKEGREFFKQGRILKKID